MSDVATPTLEDLRTAAEPAWLWDPARGRVVWANAPGLAYFGCDTLFDLIDRPFDPAEAGVERILELSRELAAGEQALALLSFPSSGAVLPVACRCSLHALADGRSGVLCAAMPAGSAGPGQEALAAAFDVMPMAAFLMAASGRFVRQNAAARAAFSARQQAQLSELTGSAADAADMLKRLAAAGTVSLIRTIASRSGSRDMRLTLRRIPHDQPDGVEAIVLADDITDRRALERRLSAEEPAHGPEPSTGRNAPADLETFDRIGQILKASTALDGKADPLVRPPETETAKPEQKTSVPRRSVAFIPVTIRSAIDQIDVAVVIARDGQLVYANPKAASLLGHPDAEAVINDEALARRLAALSQSLPALELETASGKLLNLAVEMSIIPWAGGPAHQYTLREAAAAAPALRSVDNSKSAAPAAETAPRAAAEKTGPEPGPHVRAASPDGADPLDSDAELRAILDTATDGIITLDKAGRVHSFSAGAEAIFGYRIAEVADKPFADLLASDSRKVLRDYLAALQGPGVASVFNDGREVVAVVKQGGTVPLFLTIGRLQAARSTAAFCAVVRDITQWKKTEQELREAKEAAESTSRQKSEFLARISHELRTPLNAILGFSEVMRLGRFGEIGNEKYRGYLNDIHASGAHLLSLINDLLDLSKVEAGRLELNFTSVSLSDAADHALQMLQEQAAAARVVLRKAMPADLPNVVADIRSMRQILINLISNAIKFTDPGGQVIISALLSPSGELTLRVKDTGIGMNDDQLRQALEPFSRVTTQGRDVPGTGLGLPLTKALAEANRARFAISSEPRKGTMVSVTFPTTRVLAG